MTGAINQYAAQHAVYSTTNKVQNNESTARDANQSRENNGTERSQTFAQVEQQSAEINTNAINAAQDSATASRTAENVSRGSVLDILV